MNPFRTSLKLFNNEQDRWELWLPVLVGVGIVFYFNLAFEPPVWLLGGVLIVAPILAALWDHVVFRVIAFTLLAFMLGFNAAQLETYLNMAPMLDHVIASSAVTGRLTLTTIISPEEALLTLDEVTIDGLSPNRTPLKLRLTYVHKPVTNLPPAGSHIHLLAQIGPGVEPLVPGGQNPRREDFFAHVGGVGWSDGDLSILAAPPPSNILLDASLILARNHLRLSEDIATLVSGDIRDRMLSYLNTADLRDTYSDLESTKTLHSFYSLADLKVILGMLFLYLPLRILLARFRGRTWPTFATKIPALITFTFTTFYLVLAGFVTLTPRTTLVISVIFTAISMVGPISFPKVWTLAVTLLLLIVPHAVLLTSVQLSYGVLFAMIAAYDRSFSYRKETSHLDISAIKNEVADLPDEGDVPRFFSKTMFFVHGTFFSALIVVPCLIYNLRTLDTPSIAATLLTLPIGGFWIIPCLMFALVTAPFGFDLSFIRAAAVGCGLTSRMANFLNTLPLLHAPAMPIAALFLIIFGSFWLFLWRNPWRYLGISTILIGAFYPLYTSPPDLIISSDGREWAAQLENRTFAVVGDAHDPKTIQGWQQYYATASFVLVDTHTLTNPRLHCDKMGCIYQKEKFLVALPVLPAAALEDCEHANVVVASFPIKDCFANTVLDDQQLWRHGAVTISISPQKDNSNLVLSYVHENRGERPWSAGWSALDGTDNLIN